jgi:hypothetical protein
VKHGTDFGTGPERVAEILTGATLPNAPLSMPKQVLESRANWLLFFYVRLVRRQPRVRAE